MQQIDGEDDFQAALRDGIINLDEGVDTWVKIGCYRETERLDRMLRVFRKALSIAFYNGLHERMRKELISLYDRKGELTAQWVSTESVELCRIVDVAWESEGEHSAIHEDSRGRRFIYPEVDSAFPPS